MNIPIKVPQLPESVSEAILLDWHHSLNSFVQREDNLIDLETDKVVMELPAPDNGQLIELIGKRGDVVTSGTIIAYLDTDVQPSTQHNPVETVNVQIKPTSPSNSTAKSIPVSMPSATKIATENAIDVNVLNGTGRGGRILKEDVLLQINNPHTSRIEERVPMSNLRKRVADRLVKSQQTNAILTTFNEVNMQSIMNIRNKYKESFEKKYSIKLGFMAFFVQAVVHALKQYPILNASIDGNDIVYHGYFDIGVAVSSQRGLVVPIISDSQTMSAADIELKIADFGARAKTGKLELNELTGGTFTITNGGTFGSMMSTPIINPPQSAILGMHAIKDRAVVENGIVVVRPMMYLALSYDHRLIDGRDAVLGLVAIKDALEDPARLLLQL